DVCDDLHEEALAVVTCAVGDEETLFGVCLPCGAVADRTLEIGDQVLIALENLSEGLLPKWCGGMWVVIDVNQVREVLLFRVFAELPRLEVDRSVRAVQKVRMLVEARHGHNESHSGDLSL